MIRWNLTRHRVAHGLLALLLAPAILLGMPRWAAANPLPEAALLVHVQAEDPEFCDQCPIGCCPEIVQYTEDTGTLEFDLFVYAAAGIPISALDATLEWTQNWDLLSWEICNAGVGTLEIEGSQADLDITWPSCPQMTEDVFLAARFILDAPSSGSFGATGPDNYVMLSCPPDIWEAWALPGRAQAGVECSYCYVPCDLSTPCQPGLDPSNLSLAVIQGETTQATIHAVTWGGGLEQCSTDYEATEDWMELAIEWLHFPEECNIIVMVDASTLAPGMYQGWVRAVSDCVGCTRVNLEVLPAAQGVWDEDGPGGDPPASTVNWGRLKALYR